MTVNEMIERLQELADGGMGDSELRLATQPNWPLQSHVGGIAAQEPEEDDTEPGVVYICEGSQVYDTPYAPKWAFDECR